MVRYHRMRRPSCPQPSRKLIKLNTAYEFWKRTEEPVEPGWRRVARIASTPPLRDYIVARLLEMVSKWMFRVTTSLVVWELTRDERMLAAALVFLLLPGLVMELVGGFFADRYDRRMVIILSCLGSIACNLLVALLALVGGLSIPLLFSLVTVYGAINAVSHASTKTIVTAFVPREHLSTAVSLNTVVFNVAGFIGPALAALVLSSLGTATAYLVCAVLSMGFIALFRRIPPPRRDSSAHQAGFLTALRHGLAHVLAVRLLLLLFVVHIGAIALARPFVEFVPAIVDHAFAGGAREAGIMLSAFGLGSVAGGLWLASREADTVRLVTIALSAMPAVAMAFLGIILSPYFPLAVAFSFAAGFGMILRGGAIQSLLQLVAHPSYRGRVMALHGVTFELGCIVGATVLGQLASAYSLDLALSLSVAIILALWLAIKGPMLASAAAVPARG